MAKQKRKILSHNHHIYIVGEADFDPKKIFENGQAFRWEEHSGAYTFVAREYVVTAKRLSMEEIFELSDDLLEQIVPRDRQRTENFLHTTFEKEQISGENRESTVEPPHSKRKRQVYHKTVPSVVVLENAGTMADYESFWRKYFDMDRDYEGLRRELSRMDSHLKRAIAYGKGFRVLKQDLFEMIICFIISSNNNIKRIKSITEKLCALAGESIGTHDEKTYYKFPTAKAIAALDAQTVQQETGAGYRADYLVKTARQIVDGAVDLNMLPDMSYEKAHEELCKLHGIGPKVADCILLFGNSMDIAFPVDTWVIKLMKHLYDCDEKNAAKIKLRGIELFGERAGIAQQYLFYYARENKIGTKEERL